MAFRDSLRFEPLPPAFNAGGFGFDCGERELTDYLCDGTAQKDQDASVARTYLVWSVDDLVGYFSILTDAIRLETKERPDGMRYSLAPAIKLGRMGVCTKYRGQDVGNWILDLVVGTAREMSGRVGIRYVTLDALKRDRLVAWYTTYGFVENRGHSKLLATIHRLVSPEKLEHVSMRFDILLEEEVVSP